MSYKGARKQTGQLGENIAANYLKKKGYTILFQNYSSRWGELDLICEKDKVIHFVEVKTRKDNKYGRPYEAVNAGKLRHLKRTIEYFVLQQGLKDRKLQLDVVGILLNPDNTAGEIRLYENVGV